MYFEYTGETLLSVSFSESVLSVLNTGGEIIMRLRFAYVLKLGLLSGVPPVSTIGIGMGSRFRFSVFKNRS
jgi:hypothetical protein